MSIRIMAQVWAAPGLGPSEKLVLLALADHADDEGVCWPGMKGIAAKCGITRRTVIRVIKSLEEKGLLSVFARGTDAGQQTTNIYRLTLQGGDKLSQGGVTQDHRGGDTGSQGGVTQDHTNHHIEPSMNHVLRGTLPDDDLPDWLDRDAWREFETYRREIRKPLTILAAKKNMAVLAEHRGAQREIVDTSIRNHWRGLFAPQRGSHAARSEKRKSAADRVDDANGGREQLPPLGN